MQGGGCVRAASNYIGVGVSSFRFVLFGSIRLIHKFSRARQPLHCPETNNC